MSMRVLSYSEACFLRLIIDELDRSRELHPKWPADIIHQSAIVAEEAGEVVKASLQFEYEDGGLQPVLMELVQAGAMCMQMYCANSDDCAEPIQDNDAVSDQKKKKAETIDHDFEAWWNQYAKKTGRVKCETKWRRLTKKQKQACLDSVEAYVRSTPDVQYRKNPLTYLNGCHWEDEIILPCDSSFPSGLTKKTADDVLEF